MIRPVGQPGDLGWVVLAHGELYAAEYGWNTHFEGLVARIVADFAAGHDREAGWIAEVDGRRAGCVLCTAQDDVTAQLRVLLVEPFARGRGIGARLVDECLDFARRAGYQRMTLFTTRAGRRLRQAATRPALRPGPRRYTSSLRNTRQSGLVKIRMGPSCCFESRTATSADSGQPTSTQSPLSVL